MASSHRKETVGKRKTAESSPPGDRKIERRKRCITHPGFNIRASSTSAIEGPNSKLKASTRTESIYPGTTGVYPRSMQRPQEPGRSRPPMATTWAPRPDPMATPMVQNVHPHRDPVVTPVMRNVHSHPAEQPTGRNIPNGPPIGSISKRLDDMLSTLFCSHIINYEPPGEFLVPKFSTYDGTNDPFDHIMHYRQQRCTTVQSISASLQGQALSWFHRLPPNSVGNFRDLSEAFVGQYLCSAQHKQNISTLQNIKMQDNESLREFVKRFGQAVLQVEACSMDVVLQIFKRSICPGTPFSNHCLKSLLQRWMTYSDEPTNIQCSKMTYVQPPNKFWLPDGHLEVIRREILNLRIGQNSLTEGRKGQVAWKCRLSHLFPYHMRSFSR
ncbi:hypothetical protein CK203_072908 [Vitis vinifera]|uniref:Retrotransposon gag domain-containing protein n=1 Tax=Vitis vinifera TaxID=29760 RepID=A0A438F1W3_VITVI|nr:hypothetical protein CK203_072908 [Vitis vinifera]